MKNIKIEDRIVVADDHGIVRMGLMQMIKRLRPDSVIDEVEDFKSLYKILSQSEFDLAIIDVNMPNGSIQEAIDYIKIHHPKLKTLVFSSQDEELYAMRYLKMGAGGYLNKDASESKIDAALSAMLKTGRYLSDEVKGAMISESLDGPTKSSAIESLSDRELQIANKLVEGITIKELSNLLNLHPSTVSTYKNRLFEKLKIQSIPELVSILNLYDK